MGVFEGEELRYILPAGNRWFGSPRITCYQSGNTPMAACAVLYPVLFQIKPASQSPFQRAARVDLVGQTQKTEEGAFYRKFLTQRAVTPQ